MSFFYSLCSSSSGNSTYLGSLTSGVLFDAGIGIRNFAKSLQSAGLTPSCVKAIFVTHEHSDHIKGLDVISSRHHLPIYGSEGTIEFLLKQGILSGDQEIHIIDKPMDIYGFHVTPFHTSHDSKESLGFRVETPEHENVGICTDLGYVSDEVFEALSGSDFIMLESNYDESMLMYGTYPFFLKKRISSPRGHLSNEQCAETIERLIRGNTKRFALAHLSEQNNRPEV
ncbi:MAG: MBL fold metallo-hydrolase, partial [Oscillospiraceae bacterium]